MTDPRAELLVQLNTVLRLTAVEASTARARVAQATSDDVREELTANAEKCDERSAAIKSVLVELGGVPDLLGIGVAKAASLARLPLEQTLPVTEALLADLALEHQLHDRAHLIRLLANTADAPAAAQLADRLQNAHLETIAWLTGVLAETARGETPKLAPTPLQSAAATARAAVTYAGSNAARNVNRAAAGAVKVASGALRRGE